MKKIFTPFSSSSFFYLKATYLIIMLLGFSGLRKNYAQSCTPISTLSCTQIQVNLPYSLSFNSGISGTLADKNGAGTGFTMADAYSGTRLSADGTPTNPNVPGYEASKLTLTSGRLQIVTNKGIASLTNNNQINALGVKVNSQGKLQIEVSLVNPFNGTSYQQAGIWFGLGDKTFLKLVAYNNKIQLYKEVNDVSGSSDHRTTSTISGLDTRTVRLRMIVDPATNTVEGFYSIDGGAYQNAGAAYSTPALSISGMGLTSTTAYAGIFATHRNSSTPVTYTFDDFGVQSLSTSGSNQAPVFSSSTYTFSLADNVALGTVAGSVRATDPNGDALTYSITAGNTNSAFAISAKTGAINVAKSLNYHTQNKYTLTVRVSDPGGLSSQATVTINVTPGTTVPAFSTISWGTAASQPYNVFEGHGKVVNGKLYTFGGFDSQKLPDYYTPTSRAYVYDPVANTWKSIAPMPPMNGTTYGGVTHAGFTTDGTDIYFAGGYTSNSSGTGQIFGTREAWKYIVAEDRYVRLPNLPDTISAGQLEYVNGKLHHIGGTNKKRTVDLDYHYVLDLGNLAGGWKLLAPLPNPRHHAGSAVYERKIYYIGGQKGHDGSLVAQKDVHQYDPATNTWTKVADLPVPSGTGGLGHISAAVTVIGSQIIVAGGESKHGTSTNLVSSYNRSTNTWTALSPLPSNRFSGVAANLGNRIFYTGGSNKNTTYRGIPEIKGTHAQLFVENLDKFPSNNDFVASRIQTPWSRDKITYNTNHDTLRVRLHNKGMGPLVVSNMVLSNRADWKIVSLKGSTYDSATAFPLTISSGTSADVRVAFVAVDSNTTLRVKLLLDNLSIISNDGKSPIKTLNLRGLWQRQGEGSREPRAQEMINIFGFMTRTGFTSTDPDKGANNKPKGDEVLSSYFVRVDTTRPVTIRQMGSYHGCCNQSETLRWYPKGNSGVLTDAVYHVPEDAQRLLPRKSRSTTYTPSGYSFSPRVTFGLKVGGKDWSDTLLTPDRKIGIRVWKAIDGQGQVIPNAYIIANDYLGTTATNYDYNDNMYYVTNIRPELGPASTSALTSTPSAVEFSEQLLLSTASFTLNLKSLGQVYPSGAKDPSLTISAVQVVGENSSEFTATMPGKTVLGPQETTTLSIGFKPVSEGLKIADLLIYYNNASSPLRVPLYGIGKASGTIVSVPYRIKSGSSSNVTTANGKTWVSDVPYAFDNLEPYTNGQLKGISATDEDVLYLTEQSSNGDKRPFRYEMPLQNGTYWVRLHFAEIYWGVPGGNLNGGAGSRVMSVSLENELRLINLDVAGEVGSASAVVKNIPVTVSDGKLNINFSASTNRPMVCAVEVYRFVAGTTSEIVSSGNLSLLTEQSAADGFEKPRVYPNPLHHKFTVEFPSMYKGMANLQLVDVVGRVHELGKSHLRTGGTTLEMDVTKLNLAPGVYFLRIKSENNKTDIIRLLVQ